MRCVFSQSDNFTIGLMFIAGANASRVNERIAEDTQGICSSTIQAELVSRRSIPGYTLRTCGAVGLHHLRFTCDFKTAWLNVTHVHNGLALAESKLHDTSSYLQPLS